MFVTVPFQAGVYKDDSPLSAEGFFVDADKIRFVRNRFQVIGGWEKASEDTFLGKARGMTSWLDNAGTPWAGFGTHLRVYAYSDGEVYDITPIVERGELTDPFDTTDTETTVNVSDTAHGLIVGQKVSFANATAVGGVTIDGAYVVATVVDADNYTIEHTSAATSTANGGGTVDYEYSLAPGLEDGTGGAGYGTGAYGVGGYGSPSDSVFFTCTHSMANWDQNLLASPRGGGIYEWSPKITSSDVVTNGAFATDTDWAKGTNWAIGSGVATASTASTALSQSIETGFGTYYLLTFTVTRSSGSVQPSFNSVNIGADIDAAGTYKRVFYGGGTQTLAFTGTSFVGTIDNVSVENLITGQIVPGAPTQNTCMIVTDEMVCMSGGTIDVETGNFNPRHIRWSDTGVGLLAALQDWTPTASNLSGSFTIQTGSRIVGMKNGRGEVLIWTDEGLTAGLYSPDPNVVYAFYKRGSGCGLIGPNAAVVAGSMAFWMAPGGEFWVYDGGVCTPLQSTVRRDVFDNLAKVQGDKVYAFHIAAYNEVWWLYPDSRDGNECSRYAMYNYVSGVWSVGTFDRSAWIDAGALRFPLACGVDGYLYSHEAGNSADGSALTWNIKSGKFDIGNGNTLFQISSIIPDFKDLQGGCQVTVEVSTYPNAPPTTFGPFSITTGTDKVDLIAVGRQASLEFSATALPAFARQGSIRADITDTGMTN